MSSIVLIPARYASTRFPGKPLTLLKGRPVIQHVYENARRSRLSSDVIVATDSETIFETVLSFGGKAVMTSGEHVSGTDRIAEASASMDHDIIVNVQGDEPLIRGEMIDEVISLLDDKTASIGTLAKKITVWREVFDPNVVKVVFDAAGFALYFSRAPIPYHRDLFGTEAGRYGRAEGIHADRGPEFLIYKHIGIYSYRKDVLAALSSMPPTTLETIERLEQLRALGNNFSIKVRETFLETMGVDTPEDLERIEKCLNSSL
jgi:3-deoxy-manno-octulosonate cytidylyltransferase (CMP-KDO synthetase)